MTIALPIDSSDCLAGHGAAQILAERAVCAFWLHSRDKHAALFMINEVHIEFAKLADALGYDVTRREPAADTPSDVAA